MLLGSLTHLVQYAVLDTGAGCDAGAETKCWLENEDSCG